VSKIWKPRLRKAVAAVPVRVRVVPEIFPVKVDPPRGRVWDVFP